MALLPVASASLADFDVQHRWWRGNSNGGRSLQPECDKRPCSESQSLGASHRIVSAQCSSDGFLRVEESTVEEFSTLLNVNVLAPFALTKLFLPEI